MLRLSFALAALAAAEGETDTRVFSLADVRAGRKPVDPLWLPFAPSRRNATLSSICSWAAGGAAVAKYAGNWLQEGFAPDERSLLVAVYDDGVPVGFSIISSTPSLGGATRTTELLEANAETLKAMDVREGTTETVAMCRAKADVNKHLTGSALDALGRRAAASLFGAHTMLGVAVTQASLNFTAKLDYMPFEDPAAPGTIAQLLLSPPDSYGYPVRAPLADEPRSHASPAKLSVSPPCLACGPDGTIVQPERPHTRSPLFMQSSMADEDLVGDLGKQRGSKQPRAVQGGSKRSASKVGLGIGKVGFDKKVGGKKKERRG